MESEIENILKDEKPILLVLDNAKIHKATDVEIACDAFVFLELQVGPLPFVDELLQSPLQTFEHRSIGALYLAVVDVDFRNQFLCMQMGTEDEPTYGEEQFFHMRFSSSSMMSCATSFLFFFS